MTKPEFIKAFGNEFKKLSNKPIFAALLDLIDTESPARKCAGKADGDRLHGAAVYLNEIYGWEALRAFIVGLRDTPEAEFEPPDKFSSPEM